MKRFLILLSILFCTTIFAHTIDWYIDGNVYQTTTCDVGDNVTPPTPQYKRGYTFQQWLTYVPIEYIESTGTQYIDTELALEPDAEIETKYRVNRLPNGWLVIYQSRNNSDSQPVVRHIYGTASNVGNILTNCNDGYFFSIPTFTIGVDYTEKMDRYGWVINGTVHNRTCTIRNQTTPAPLKIGNEDGSWYGRMYYFKIWNSGQLVRDFIPVLDYNGTPCMYDKVTEQFFYNQGTGQFIAGPVLTE